jgi:PAS domain-containing protein
VNQEECPQRLHLADEYSRLITDFNILLDSLKRSPSERNAEIWNAAELTRALSDKAWQDLERHVEEHRCTELERALEPSVAAAGSNQIMQLAALAALDVILVVNDDRRYVEVNDAAVVAIGLPRQEIIGRRIDEFFTEARGENVPAAWADFIHDGAQRGMCELNAGGQRRLFEYHAKANFAPGLHLSVLREPK